MGDKYRPVRGISQADWYSRSYRWVWVALDVSVIRTVHVWWGHVTSGYCDEILPPVVWIVQVTGSRFGTCSARGSIVWVMKCAVVAFAARGTTLAAWCPVCGGLGQSLYGRLLQSLQLVLGTVETERDHLKQSGSAAVIRQHMKFVGIYRCCGELMVCDVMFYHAFLVTARIQPKLSFDSDNVQRTDSLRHSDHGILGDQDNMPHYD